MGIKTICSTTIMNDDIILFGKSKCIVKIRGYQGAYRTINGAYVNCATGTEGYLIDEDGNAFRARFDGSRRIVKRAIPSMFPDEDWS